MSELERLDEALPPLPMTRYYALTECEHGETDPHYLNPVIPTGDEAPCLTMACPGGQRRELTGVQVVETFKPPYHHRIPVPNPGRYLVIALDETDS